MNGTALKRKDRFRCNSVLVVSWQERDITRTIRGRCVDLSETGAKIEISERLPATTLVYLRSDKDGILGHAAVRYCERSGMKFIVGLQFGRSLAASDKGRQSAFRRAQPQPPAAIL